MNESYSKAKQAETRTGEQRRCSQPQESTGLAGENHSRVPVTLRRRAERARTEKGKCRVTGGNEQVSALWPGHVSPHFYSTAISSTMSFGCYNLWQALPNGKQKCQAPFLHSEEDAPWPKTSKCPGLFWMRPLCQKGRLLFLPIHTLRRIACYSKKKKKIIFHQQCCYWQLNGQFSPHACICTSCWEPRSCPQEHSIWSQCPPAWLLWYAQTTWHSCHCTSAPLNSSQAILMLAAKPCTQRQDLRAVHHK